MSPVAAAGHVRIETLLESSIIIPKTTQFDPKQSVINICIPF